MSIDSGPLEPAPWDDDAEPAVPPSSPSGPARPMTTRELELWISMPMETRVYDAYRCMFNTMAEDGVGLGSGTYRQCKTRIADPTKGRYCLEHSSMMDVEYYSPGEYSELTAGEASANLTRLVPKAVKTLEVVMDDTDAPPGIRAKAADSVLDRTGFAKGIDVKVDAEVAVLDITSIIRDRLDALRDAKLTEYGAGPEATSEEPEAPAPHPRGTPGPRPPALTPAITTVPGTVIPEPESPFSATSFADDTIPEESPVDPPLPTDPPPAP